MEIFVVRFYLFSQKRIMQRRPIQISLKILATQQTSSTPYCLMKHFQCYPTSFGNSPACFQIIIKSHYGQHTTHISDICISTQNLDFCNNFQGSNAAMVHIYSDHLFRWLYFIGHDLLRRISGIWKYIGRPIIEHHISSVWECIQL